MSEPLESGLIAHWKFNGDCRDCSGMENHGRVHGVDLGAAGRSSRPGTTGRGYRVGAGRLSRPVMVGKGSREKVEFFCERRRKGEFESELSL